MSRFLSEKYRDLAAYTPGEQPQERQYIKLNTNESPFPPAPAVVAAAAAEAEKLHLYPDPEGRRLRAAIAARYDLEPENIFLANGSDEALSFFFMGFCDAARPVAFPDISYGFYPVYADLYRLPRQVIPLEADFTIDPASYCGIGKNIVIANPNAPTGLALGRDDVEEIVRTNPDHVVLIDEAYVDFGGESCLPLVKKYGNLLVTRTFSKSRSLAGLRLGFAAGDEALIRDMDRLRCSVNPYNVSRLALAAGEAALADEDTFRRNCRVIMENRAFTRKALLALGFTVTDSKANFLFARSGRIGGEELYRRLKAAGILVRHFRKERIDDCIRVTIGTRAQMEAFLAATAAILEE